MSDRHCGCRLAYVPTDEFDGTRQVIDRRACRVGELRKALEAIIEDDYYDARLDKTLIALAKQALATQEANSRSTAPGLAELITLLEELEWAGQGYTRCPNCFAPQYGEGEKEIHLPHCSLNRWLTLMRSDPDLFAEIAQAHAYVASVEAQRTGLTMPEKHPEHFGLVDYETPPELHWTGKRILEHMDNLTQEQQDDIAATGDIDLLDLFGGEGVA